MSNQIVDLTKKEVEEIYGYGRLSTSPSPSSTSSVTFQDHLAEYNFQKKIKRCARIIQIITITSYVCYKTFINNGYNSKADLIENTDKPNKEL